MIIGITGLPKSGKTFLGSILKNKLKNYHVTSFAEILKEVTAVLMNVSPTLFEDREFKNSLSSSEWWFFTTKDNITSEGYIINKYLKYPYHSYKGEMEIKEHFILYKPTNREVLQIIADSLKTIDSNLFINLLFSRNKNKNLIITDVRYNNEAAEIKKRGGKIIKIISSFQEKPSNHSSDKGIDCVYIDKVIKNTGIKKDLKKEIRKFIKTNNLLHNKL